MKEVWCRAEGRSWSCMAAETAADEENLEENAIDTPEWFSGLILFLKCAFKISF